MHGVPLYELQMIGTAVFAAFATEKVLALGFGAVVVIMGVLTSIGGGLARDGLAGRPTRLMSREIDATPVLIGCAAYVLLRTLRWSRV